MPLPPDQGTGVPRGETGFHVCRRSDHSTTTRKIVCPSWDTLPRESHSRLHRRAPKVLRVVWRELCLCETRARGKGWLPRRKEVSLGVNYTIDKFPFYEGAALANASGAATLSVQQSRWLFRRYRRSSRRHHCLILSRLSLPVICVEHGRRTYIEHNAQGGESLFIFKGVSLRFGAILSEVYGSDGASRPLSLS